MTVEIITKLRAKKQIGVTEMVTKQLNTLTVILYNNSVYFFS